MIRFKNGNVLTMDGGCAVESKEVWVEGDRICFVGKPTDEQLKAAVFEREFDLDGDLLMPALKNAHTHSAMTFLRSYADDLPLQQWLFDRVFPLEAKLTGEDVYWFARLAILEYLTSGVSASFDMYFKLDDYVKANIDSGFRTVMCHAVSGPGERVKEVEECYLKFNGMHPLIGLQLGFHAEYTASYELMENLAGLAEKYKAPVSMHNSETASEVADCIKRWGKTPTQLFDSLGLYNYGGSAYHCVHVTEEDERILAERGVWVVTNPCSNAKLISGTAPIAEMDRRGIRLAIGTDGPASNNALDMFREMYLLSVLQKLKEADATAMQPERILEMACRGSALAMGLDDCDCIAQGKQADLIVIDMKRPNMQPVHNIPKNLIYSGSKENVRMTMVAGKVRYLDGEFFVGEDAERIYAKCNEHTQELIKR